MSKKAAPKPRKGSEPPSIPDDVFISLARDALKEVTPANTFDDAPVVSRDGGGVTVRFPSSQPGYPGWAWNISLAALHGSAPTVLELQLLPGDGALLSPEWVPWADRLEEYLLHEKEVKDQEATDDEDDEDFDDLDDDVDGVDIDQLDIDLDPSPLEVPDEPDDLVDYVEVDEPEGSP